MQCELIYTKEGSVPSKLIDELRAVLMSEEQVDKVYNSLFDVEHLSSLKTMPKDEFGQPTLESVLRVHGITSEQSILAAQRLAQGAGISSLSVSDETKDWLRGLYNPTLIDLRLVSDASFLLTGSGPIRSRVAPLGGDRYEVMVSIDDAARISKEHNIPMDDAIAYIMAHEVNHIYFNESSIKRMTDREEVMKIFERAKEEWKFASKKPNTRAFYSINEFLTEAVSNKEFSEWLRSVPYQSSNLMTKIWDSVVKFISFMIGKPSSKRIVSMYDKIYSMYLTARTAPPSLSSTQYLADPGAISSSQDDFFDALMAEASEITEDKDKNVYYDSKNPDNIFMRISDYAKGVMSLFRRKEKVGPSAAEWEAASIWGARFEDGKWVYSISKDTPQMTNVSPTPVTWDEFITIQEGYYDKYAAKGRLLHQLIMMAFSGRYTNDEIIKAFSDGITGSKINPYLVNWIISMDPDEKKMTMFKAIAEKMGLNIYDTNLPAEQKDKLLHEVVIFNRILNWAGRSDLLVKHSDGYYSLFDFKSAKDMDRQWSANILKYGRADRVVTENKRDLAHLQLSLYAVLLKLRNPSVQFRDIAISHIADQASAKLKNPTDSVPVGTFIPMIEAFLRNERPDEYSKLKEQLGEEAFAKVWDPREYSSAYSSSLTTELQTRTPSELYHLKATNLREMLQFSADDETFKFSPSEELAKRREYIKKTMSEIVELKKAGGLDEQTWKEDISWMSSWIGTNPDIANPYVRIFHEVLEEAMLNASKAIQGELSEHNKYFKPVWEQYKQRREGWKSGLAKLTFEKVNFSKYADVFDFLYRDQKNEAGETIRKALNTTDEHFAEWEAAHPGRRVSAEEKAYARFLDSRFKFFLTSPDSYYNKHVGEILNPITNQIVNATPLMLYNGIESPRSEQFEYWEGWFPRMAITREEVLSRHKINQAGFWRDLFRRYFTHYFENQFDRWAASKEEMIPIKGLGTNYLNAAQNHTLNMEEAFGKFVSSYYHKMFGDEVYALGRSIKLFSEMKAAEGTMPQMKNLVSFVDKQMQMVLLGRRQKSFQGKFTRTVFTNDDGEEFSWVKGFQSLKGWASSTVMWIKPITGIKNGVFLLMTTAKDSILREWMGYKESVPYKDFGVKGLVKGSADFFELQKDAINNTLYKNKAWLLAKHLRYLPDQEVMRAAHRDNLATRNRFFDQGTLYIFHSFFEEWAAISTMSAQLRSSTFKLEDGTTVSLWDMYEVVEKDEAYKLEWKKDAKGNPIARGYVNKSKDSKRPDIQPLTEITPEEAIAMKYVYQRMMGGYRPEERTALEYYVFGQLFLQMRKYLPNILKSAMMSRGKRGLGHYELKSYSESGLPMYEWVSRAVEGRWLIFGKTILAGLTGISKIKAPGTSWVSQWINNNFQNLESYRWAELTPQDREAVYDMILTWAFLGMMFGGSLAIFDPEDDKEIPLRKLWARMMADFSQQVNPVEVFKLVADTKPASFRVMSRFVLGMANLTQAAFFYSIGMEEKALTPKGHLRGSLEVFNTLPISSQFMDIVRFGQGYDVPYFEDFLKLHGNDLWRNQ